VLGHELTEGDELKDREELALGQGVAETEEQPDTLRVKRAEVGAGEPDAQFEALAVLPADADTQELEVMEALGEDEREKLSLEVGRGVEVTQLLPDVVLEDEAVVESDGLKVKLSDTVGQDVALPDWLALAEGEKVSEAVEHTELVELEVTEGLIE